MSKRALNATVLGIGLSVLCCFLACPASYAKKKPPQKKKEPTPQPWVFVGWVTETNGETRHITVSKEKDLDKSRSRVKKKGKSEEQSMAVTLSNDVIFVFGHSTIPMSDIKVNDHVKLKGERLKGQPPVITMVVKLTEEPSKEKAHPKKPVASTTSKSEAGH